MDRNGHGYANSEGHSFLRQIVDLIDAKQPDWIDKSCGYCGVRQTSAAHRREHEKKCAAQPKTSRDIEQKNMLKDAIAEGYQPLIHTDRGLGGRGRTAHIWEKAQPAGRKGSLGIEALLPRPGRNGSQGSYWQWHNRVKASKGGSKENSSGGAAVCSTPIQAQAARAGKQHASKGTTSTKGTISKGAAGSVAQGRIQRKDATKAAKHAAGASGSSDPSSRRQPPPAAPIASQSERSKGKQRAN